MKKVLIASTALVAATMLSAGTASASEKIKLNLGGFSKWWVVGAWQDDSFQANNNKAGVEGDYNSVDIKGDNEIYFSGSTTLDNGLQVGIQVELEAGGNTDTTGGDTIDESYVWLASGFGKFIIGSENNGTYLLHVSAPDAAGNWNEGGILTGGYAIAKPTAVKSITPSVSSKGVNVNNNNTTAIVTDNDADKITYVAPTFYGLTVGASYVPNVKEDDRGATSWNSNATGDVLNDKSGTIVSEIYGVGALYANTFGGVGVKVSAGWVTYDLNQTAVANGKDGVQEWAAGTQLSYAGFTLGGSYRKVDADRALDDAVGLDGNAWDIGLQYASGPYAISASYFKSSVDAAASSSGEDEVEFYQVSGKYTLGAGVDALATIGHASYQDEGGLQENENDGWTVMTGLSLAF